MSQSSKLSQKKLSQKGSPFSGPGPMRQYRQFLEQGKFRIQQCTDCGRHIFQPRVLCNHCGSRELKWIEASGRGTVYSTSVVRQKPERGSDYNIALIDLEEGPRMMSRVVDVAPEKVKIGMRVSAHITLLDGQPAVMFSTREQGVSEW